MKKILLIIVCGIGLMACENANIMYINPYYSVVKMNDSIAAIIQHDKENRREGVKFVNLKNIKNEHQTLDKE